MRKVPTIYKRVDGYVIDELVPGVDWVFGNESIPRYKWDGTAMYFDGNSWFARRAVTSASFRPINFIPVETDSNTNKTFGWIPIQESPFNKFFLEAVEQEPFESDLYGRKISYEPGSYELIGPKINGNPENMQGHRLVSHKRSPILDNLNQINYSFTAFKRILPHLPCEGVIWYGPEGKLAKLKGKDFRV